ncbi:glycosyltransferase family 4 protein [Leptolyngbya sp. FACHB-261]|uniref:glycosyltransferase family 4 protein n=1 Tax=Leptolyngbya sp. FACHB-261 TaxID=2692806 RepID=UPI00168569B2|nr:glycosyltransferase family 4 protein [Leptolyngbya sp. FACHB-261]MBD2100216.1 glycosyltransferase family 4 protein [Leptolyngbya sp. FACHB-261]
MRIAQIAPLWERVPPPGYGGVELVVGLLTDELVRRGHEVTLFASGDSATRAQLCSVHPRALRLDPEVKEYSVYEMMQLSRAYGQASEFDVIHSHVGYAAMQLAEFVNTPTVHTLHGVFTPDGERLFKQFSHQAFLTISEAQREPRLGLNYISTVYNGIDPDAYPFRAAPQNPPYLAFVGRISPEKGPHLAIQVAREAGLPLLMAGKVDAVDRDYYHDVIHPLIDGKQITYLGEVTHQEKAELLGGALATLFTITWREPFGLVMVESMACGTPVLAMRMGSAPEVIAHGKTGFLVNDPQEMVDLIEPTSRLSRSTCREHVLSRFCVRSMVDGYEAAYRQVIAERAERNGKLSSPPVTQS